ncbi:MAG: HEAT repeat domain-containing protein [Planctomycetes bacterium]|nr:HEAT repeat domain-containing protein [Planctomycetota bacterium]MCB9884529.1 HEAT repeat domain-containing protein [Planctomycetota bacterium]
MLAALLTSLLLWQEPGPAPQPPTPQSEAEKPVPQDKPVETPTPIEAWDDRTAKAAAAELTKVMKGKSSSMREKTQALEAVAKGSNKLLIKPLVKVVEEDKSLLVRQRAAALLANQPEKDANDALRKLLKNPRVGSYPVVQAELIKALAKCGYDGKQWDSIADLFEQEYAAERVTLQEAILDLVAQHKEKQALPMLLRNFDEPSPKNVHDGSNPPAEYWEARWKAWASWRAKVKDTVFAVTGQRFTSATEAGEWLKKNPL